MHRADDSKGSLWIFGYGSLMWQPGFEFEEAVPARVEGWRRGFYIYSTYHRGTHGRPGLVLALDRGGSCRGVAFRVASGNALRTLAYLRAREQVDGIYREQLLKARLDDGSGREVEAIAYVVERGHPGYAGRLPLHAQARLIRGAAGISGANLPYLASTVRRLEELGVREHELRRLMVVVGAHLVRKADPVAIERTARILIGHSARFRVPVAPLRRLDERRFMHRVRIAEWSGASFRSTTRDQS